MTLSLLTYQPTSQNQRVAGLSVASEETPRIYDSEVMVSSNDKSDLIQAAYRQIFHEQQMLSCYQQPFLESQLRNNQITTKDFVRGLLMSDSFRRLNFDSNNNYRFVQLCIQRVLGREVFGDREKMAWSTVIATKGLAGFVDALLNSDEYEQAFSDSVVPYQRRRMLPQRPEGDLPFARMTRYDGSDRPDLLTQLTDGLLWAPKDAGDVGTGLFIAAMSILIVTTLLLVFGSAASL